MSEPAAAIGTVRDAPGKLRLQPMAKRAVIIEMRERGSLEAKTWRAATTE